MSNTVNATIVSSTQLASAVCYFGTLNALRRVGSFDVRADTASPFSVMLEVDGESLETNVVAVIGSGAMLEFSQRSLSSDDEVRSMYFGVRQVYSPASVYGSWEINPQAEFGDGSIDDYNAAALAVARYVYG